jgi:ABC-2 type transport system permease protein
MKDVFLQMFPGMMFFWVLFVGQTPMQEILLEKESHVLQRILAAPVTISQFLWSKILRCFLLCGIIQGLLLGLTSLLFGLSWGALLPLAAAVTASALGITGLLAFIYSLARTKEQANAITPVLLLALALLGGSMFPFEELPRFLQIIGQFSPNRWGIMVFRGTAQGQSWSSLLPPLAKLLALGGGGSLLAIGLMRYHLARGGAR